MEKFSKFMRKGSEVTLTDENGNNITAKLDQDLVVKDGGWDNEKVFINLVSGGTINIPWSELPESYRALSNDEAFKDYMIKSQDVKETIKHMKENLIKAANEK